MYTILYRICGGRRFAGSFAGGLQVCSQHQLIRMVIRRVQHTLRMTLHTAIRRVVRTLRMTLYEVIRKVCCTLRIALPRISTSISSALKQRGSKM